jgi:hypothetical protein
MFFGLYAFVRLYTVFSYYIVVLYNICTYVITILFMRVHLMVLRRVGLAVTMFQSLMAPSPPPVTMMLRPSARAVTPSVPELAPCTWQQRQRVSR